jgi:hypothetical protein
LSLTRDSRLLARPTPQEQNMTTVPIDAFFIVIMLIAAISALAGLVNQKQHALSLKRHFAPEYDHAVFETSRSKHKAGPHRLRTVKRNAYANRIS